MELHNKFELRNFNGLDVGKALRGVTKTWVDGFSLVMVGFLGVPWDCWHVFSDGACQVWDHQI
jgi:hypothetical protein